MKINIERLKTNMLEVGKIGALEEGISRIAFSKEEKEAQKWLVDKFSDLGLTSNIDSVGNAFGYYGGDSDKEIIIGSHLDTVPKGGLYDGALGVLASLEVVQTLKENNIKLPYGVRVASFVAEEGGPAGGTFGSRCVTGEIENLASEIQQSIGLTMEDIKNAKLNSENIKCYLELHIEQGNVLEHENKPIGIVTGIAGIHRFAVRIKGLANHAGTTPMDLRDDALLKSTYLIQEFYRLVEEIGGDLVGTIGTLEITPGAMNVIPGQVDLVIEMRSMDFTKTDMIINNLKEVLSSKDYNFKEIVRKDGVILSTDMINTIEIAVKVLNYPYKVMHSGAGHDANPMAKVTPTGMIFIPSIAGISHSPRENSRWIDVEKGANVLLNTLLRIE